MLVCTPFVLKYLHFCDSIFFSKRRGHIRSTTGWKIHRVAVLLLSDKVHQYWTNKIKINTNHLLSQKEKPTTLSFGSRRVQKMPSCSFSHRGWLLSKLDTVTSIITVRTAERTVWFKRDRQRLS
jgi:hypothetical protein